jgi:hypothetical protein
MKHTASAEKKSSSRSRSTFAVCVRNDDYQASLELRKLYSVLPDEFGDQHDMIRVVDESGEDYLYPNSYFVRVELPRAVQQAIEKIA